ncbi:replicative helicase loader/inhibitor [Paenibacillus macquariensis]|uniref:Loader and inhibitor of phage G40P n=1 Tax=Paenibacillus macquariensis TaxID=948756 RepID=A0ABY1KEU0_9BACL|nr:replicative helicase loader/inhibitor [Paenibacillus macquariensis]MEC0092478.1 replicative helicase loader/inhibitor [Paenibacillus macquariensis]OAB35436.1 hypothetical protein PMSM_09270 [Paenibacillus macquariensis subsp. macquariensis]SIR72629.1 Loader and inhibitor of phage G40P [Paenibacillus macquariensis]
MQRDEAKKVFAKLASCYPNWKVDKTIAENWIDELETEDAENAWANVKEYIRTERYAPTLSDVIKSNANLAAEREKERTRKALQDQDKLRESLPRETPWVREGISRGDWMKKVIEENRVKG